MRVGLGPTPLLYFAAFTRGTDGAVMVTGSHNPPEYNGFKMMVGKKPFYGKDILELGRLAAAGDVVAEGAGKEETVDLQADYVARLAKDWDGGERKLKVVWDNGNGAAGVVLQELVKHLRASTRSSSPRSTGISRTITPIPRCRRTSKH